MSIDKTEITGAMPEIISPVGEDYRDYLHDETKTVGRADSISFPRSEDEIRRTLRHFNTRGEKVAVQGNRTGLTAASVPNGGHVLSLTYMDKVLGMSIGDGGEVLVRVQPGLSLGVFRSMIASKSFGQADWDEASLAALKRFRAMPAQYFPPDPTESSASLGGMAACNSSGAKTYHYGPTRPYINGLRVVLADGDVIALRRGGRRAEGRHFSLTTESGRTIEGELPHYTMPGCKNASGYFAEDDMDLVDMFVGSDGTLGVITELELRLIPMPRVIWGVNCFFRTEEQALGFVDGVKAAGTAAALEYFDCNALDILRAHDDGGCPVPRGFACMIYVEIHTDDEDAGLAAVRELGRIMDAAGADCADTWCARSVPDRERLLELRHRVPESVNALIARRKTKIPAIAKVGSDMAVPDGRFRELMKIYRRDLEKNGFEFAIWGHIGNNHLHVNVLPRTEEDMRRGKAMFLDWAKTVTEMGGTVSAEHGAGKNKANLLPVLYGEKGVREMAALKRCFDPQCMLGAGNLFPAEYV